MFFALDVLPWGAIFILQWDKKMNYLLTKNVSDLLKNDWWVFSFILPIFMTISGPCAYQNIFIIHWIDCVFVSSILFPFLHFFIFFISSRILHLYLDIILFIVLISVWHYGKATWPSRRLQSPVIQLFIQQLLKLIAKGTSIVCTIGHSEGNPPVALLLIWFNFNSSMDK